MRARRKLAAWLRRTADRIDLAGAPKRTSWSLRFEDGFGPVLGQDGRGCPLWYYGDADYALAHAPDGTGSPQECDVQWVTVGSGVPGAVTVLNGTAVSRAVLTRHMAGFDTVQVPGARRPARVPRWQVTLHCEIDSFTSLPGATYAEAIRKTFGR